MLYYMKGKGLSVLLADRTARFVEWTMAVQRPYLRSQCLASFGFTGVLLLVY